MYLKVVEAMAARVSELLVDKSKVSTARTLAEIILSGVSLKRIADVFYQYSKKNLTPYGNILNPY